MILKNNILKFVKKEIKPQIDSGDNSRFSEIVDAISKIVPKPRAKSPISFLTNCYSLGNILDQLVTKKYLQCETLKKYAGKGKVKTGYCIRDKDWLFAKELDRIIMEYFIIP